jgi:hypothetical protein
MSVGAMRMAVFLRDMGCVAPRIDPDAGPCRDVWGMKAPAHPLAGMELDYVRRGSSDRHHVSERDHVTLCPGHHRGTGAQAGATWATSHREELRAYLDRFYGPEGEP